MSWQVTRLQPEEFAEAIDLINYVFSHTYGPHDFETLLPKLYRPDPELVRCHYGVREAGALVALAGSYPLTWQVGESALRVAGIGAVATHPRHRGRGLMRAVVGHCVDEARAAGCHLSWLDGLGHRYRHFGYERAGAEISFQLTARDFAGAGVDGAGMRFRRLQEGDALLQEAARLHAGQRVYWRRPPAELPRICASWGGALYAALEGDTLAAYLVAGRDRSAVTELVAVDAATAVRAAAGWCADRAPAAGHRGGVALAARGGLAARRAGRLHARAVLRQLAGVRLARRARRPAGRTGALAKRCPLARRWSRSPAPAACGMWVDGAAAGCEPTDAAPQVRLDGAAALRAFGGPLPGCFPDPDAVPAALAPGAPSPCTSPPPTASERRAARVGLPSTRPIVTSMTNWILAPLVLHAPSMLMGCPNESPNQERSA